MSRGKKSIYAIVEKYEKEAEFLFEEAKTKGGQLNLNETQEKILNRKKINLPSYQLYFAVEFMQLINNMPHNSRISQGYITESKRFLQELKRSSYYWNTKKIAVLYSRFIKEIGLENKLELNLKGLLEVLNSPN